MSEISAVVFGAGKIARGFIAHLLTLSSYRITFVEKNPALIAALRTRGHYRVHIMGAPEKSLRIEGFQVLSTEEGEEVTAAIRFADVVFVSVGGPNLPEVAPLLRRGIVACAASGRSSGLNIVLCENYFEPAAWLHKMIAEGLGPSAGWMENHTGFVETMVLRSVVEPDETLKADDPLALSAQDMWEIPADGEAFRGEIPKILGLKSQPGFRGSLIRKLFTYNATNAAIAYMGYLKGYTLLSEAANDPELAAFAREAADESGPAICAKYGFDPEEQRKFAESAIAKYQNRAIVDPIERNARDPIRKLGRNDRLVGPACLAYEYGARPVASTRAIAAALHYDCGQDPAATRLQAMIREKGLDQVIRQVCGLDPEKELGSMIAEAYKKLATTALAP